MTDEPHEPHEPHESGSGRADPGDLGDLGEEAAKLLGVLAGWTRTADEHIATGAAECQWCPVCRVVHVVRTSSPEVRDHLATAASSLLQAAAGLLSAATEARPADRTRDDLEHIDLDDPTEGEEQP